jgi:hypothetical protein
MINFLYGLSFLHYAIIILVIATYIGILLSLGWESHSKYGTGYWWVGFCLLGVIAAVVNYSYWKSFQAREDLQYPLWLMIVVNFFLIFAGLWAYLIYHMIFLKKSKARRSGTRLERRVFAEDQASTGSGRFREFLKGWEGDMKLDILVVEKKFSEAEDYLEGVILKANSERDTQKAKHYEQYRTVITRERIFAESTKAFEGDKPSEKDAPKFKTPAAEEDFGKFKDIKEEDLPEGWQMPD